MNKIGNFSILSRQEITEYEAELIHLIHETSGLEVCHIKTEDKENLFAFVFRTPVKDDTGIPHIMEHSTLCGSHRFPLKDPFVFLLKGSMNTYLNAFTSQDCTVYLAGSTLKKDFFNLMMVYGDAVFNPLLKEEVFLQEGFHYEKHEKLTIQGVVYNEMKGNYSSPESIISNWSTRALFPDTTYGCDTGGDPSRIPDLTYQDFLDFYRKFYTPANCKLFLYGDTSTEELLEFTQTQFLQGRNREPVDSRIYSPASWTEPRSLKINFHSPRELKKENNTTAVLSWLTCPVQEPFQVLLLEFIYEAILGNPGSPLRKELVESGLGQDISPASGLDTGLTEVVFSTGLRGMKQQDVQEMEALIFRVLNRIMDKGLDDEIIEATLHRIEFRKKEINSSGPFGIRLLFKTLRGWLQDAEPVLTLEYARHLKKLKSLVKKEPDFYKGVIKKYLINNNHRATVILSPGEKDPQAGELEKRIKKLQQNKELYNKAMEDYEKFKAFQAHKDTPEDEAKIPLLKISDLPEKVNIPGYQETLLSPRSRLFYHKLHTNKIIYLDIAFDFGHISREDVPYLPLFSRLLTGCGVNGMPYDELSRAITLHTGGLSPSLSINESFNGDLKLHLMLSLKALEEKLEPSMDLLERIVLESDFTDFQRVSNLTTELYNRMKASIIPHGNYYAALRAGARLSHSFALEETLHGITQFASLEMINNLLQSSGEKLIKRMERVSREIFASPEIAINICCEEPAFKRAETRLMTFLNKIPPFTGSRTPQPGLLEKTDMEAIVTSSKVNYVAQALPSGRYGTKDNAVEAVLAHYLNTGPLWDKVRLEGGAYGASASSYGLEGIYTFSSFRDPRLTRTLEAFRESLRMISENPISRTDLERAIIGTIGKDERPLRGTRLGQINFKRKLFGITDEMRQNHRDYVLGLTEADFTRRAGELLNIIHEAPAVAITNQKALSEEGITDQITTLPL